MIIYELFAESLPAKNLNQLYQIKQQLAQPAPAQQQAATPAPAQTTTPQPQKSLTQLQGERAKLDQIIKLKDILAQKIKKAQSTRVGIPRGLAADIEMDYALPASDADYNDTIALYQKQIQMLDQHIARQKSLYRESINESTTTSFVKKFLPWLKKEIGLDSLPKIELVKELDTNSFGTYDGENNVLYVVTANRHPVDVLRTLAHELTHYKQNLDGRLQPESGETGSKEENEANAQAGVVMRSFAQSNPDYLLVNEQLEDTPPEVLRALDQAAQKSGYKNWQDVLSNPKSSAARMQVAKLASTILKMPPLHKPTKTF